MPLGRASNRDKEIADLENRTNSIKFYRQAYEKNAGADDFNTTAIGFKGKPNRNSFTGPDRLRELDIEKLNKLKQQRDIGQQQTTRAPILPSFSGQGDVDRVDSLDSYVEQNQFDKINPLIAEDEAVRGVEQEFTGARQRELRELGRIGVSPTAGRARSSSQRRALNLALARSGARLESRKATDDSNLQREQAGRELALSTRGQDITQRGQDVSSRTALQRDARAANSDAVRQFNQTQIDQQNRILRSSNR